MWIKFWGKSQSSSKRNELREKLVDFKVFEEGDLKILDDCSWEEAAYHVWHDMVKSTDPKGPQHSQKWAGMINARLLKSIADDSARTVCLTWVLVVLTLALVADIGIRLCH